MASFKEFVSISNPFISSFFREKTLTTLAIENKDKDLSYLNERVKALCAKYPLYI